MTMNITSKQMEITPAIRQHVAINELINKLERQLNKVQHKGEARRATASVKDASFVEAEEE